MGIRKYKSSTTQLLTKFYILDLKVLWYATVTHVQLDHTQVVTWQIRARVIIHSTCRPTLLF
jgi:hypothetical protein